VEQAVGQEETLPDEPTSQTPKGSIELSPELRSAVLERIAKMPAKERSKVRQSCEAAALSSGARQVELVSSWKSREKRAREKLEPATEPTPHDAKVFKGGPPRKLIKRDHDLWNALRAELGEKPVPEWPRGVEYEFSTGRIVRVQGGPTEDERALTALVAGVLPDQDLAEALVAQVMDRAGLTRKEAEFFGHLYADREARAFEGITLFEVWSRSVPLEVPDVDARAYGLKIFDAKEMPLPLTDKDHALWYPRMSLSLNHLRRRVMIATSLAAVWFDGRPKLEEGYEASIDTLHAVIATAEEDADKVAEQFARDDLEFLPRALESIQLMGNDGWNAGNARRDELSEGREAIRQAVLGVLQKQGLLQEKTSGKPTRRG
jgi:hypothetical protein